MFGGGGHGHGYGHGHRHSGVPLSPRLEKINRRGDPSRLSHVLHGQEQEEGTGIGQGTGIGPGTGYGQGQEQGQHEQHVGGQNRRMERREMDVANGALDSRINF